MDSAPTGASFTARQPGTKRAADVEPARLGHWMLLGNSGVCTIFALATSPHALFLIKRKNF